MYAIIKFMNNPGKGPAIAPATRSINQLGSRQPSNRVGASPRRAPEASRRAVQPHETELVGIDQIDLDRQMDRPGRCRYVGDPDRQMRCVDGGSRGFVTSRSRHPGGVQVCMADGSVRFVNETIELETWLVMLAGSNQGMGVLSQPEFHR